MNRTLWVMALLVGGVLGGQTKKSTVDRVVQIDPNGNPVSGVTATVQGADGSVKRVEKGRNPSGDLVPKAEFEERVISNDGVTRKVERIERVFTPEGQPLPAKRTVIEETKRGESVTTTTTVYGTDLNGNQTIVERARAEVQRSGDTVTSLVKIERPGNDGSLRPTERVEATTRKLGEGQTSQTVTVFNPDNNGNFQEREKQVSERREDGRGGVTENTAVYQNLNGSSLSLAEQRVTRGQKSADGSEQTVTDIFTTNGAAVGSSDNKPQLAAREIVQKKALRNGGAQETVSVQRVDFNDPGKLTAPEVVASSTCSGDCLTKPEAKKAEEKK